MKTCNIVFIATAPVFKKLRLDDTYRVLVIRYSVKNRLKVQKQIVKEVTKQNAWNDKQKIDEIIRQYERKMEKEIKVTKPHK